MNTYIYMFQSVWCYCNTMMLGAEYHIKKGDLTHDARRSKDHGTDVLIALQCMKNLG